VTSLAEAADAARQGLRSLVSLHRRGFAADVARALAAPTGALRGQLAADRAKTLRAVGQGDFDLVGVVRALAVESARCDTVIVLAQLDGYQVTNGRRGDDAVAQGDAGQQRWPVAAFGGPVGGEAAAGRACRRAID
jgi:hypothetical protein